MKSLVLILVLDGLIAFVNVKRRVKNTLDRSGFFRGTKVQGKTPCHLHLCVPMCLWWELGLKSVSGKKGKGFLPRLGGSGMSYERHQDNGIKMFCVGKSALHFVISHQCHQSLVSP